MSIENDQLRGDGGNFHRAKAMKDCAAVTDRKLELNLHFACLAVADAIEARRSATTAEFPPNARDAVERLRLIRLRLEEAKVLLAGLGTT